MMYVVKNSHARPELTTSLHKNQISTAIYNIYATLIEVEEMQILGIVCDLRCAFIFKIHKPLLYQVIDINNLFNRKSPSMEMI